MGDSVLAMIESIECLALLSYLAVRGRFELPIFELTAHRINRYANVPYLLTSP